MNHRSHRMVDPEIFQPVYCEIAGEVDKALNQPVMPDRCETKVAHMMNEIRGKSKFTCW